MKKLVLIRHGESEWNKLNLFTGWTDVELSDNGVNEAKKAGIVLNDNGYQFDICFTSVLKRAIHTAWYALNGINQIYIPVIKDYRLNERHYGTLQGLNKLETTELYGAEQVHIWRRSYDVAPPILDYNDKRNPAFDIMYKNNDKNKLPLHESLKDTEKRVIPYFESDIAPLIKKGKNVLIVAHGNSLRSLIKYFDKISDDEISNVNIPTGIPLVYEFDNSLNPIKHYYLGDNDEVLKKINEVSNQDKKK